MLPTFSQDLNLRCPQPDADAECVPYCNTSMEREQEERELHQCCRVTFTFIFNMGFWISGIVFLAHDYDPTDNLWVYCMGVEVGSIALAIIATFLYHCLDHGKLIDGRASKHPYQWGFLLVNSIFIWLCAVVGGVLLFTQGNNNKGTSLSQWAMVAFIVACTYCFLDILIYTTNYLVFRTCYLKREQDQNHLWCGICRG
jgi:hypothetical protein